MGALQLTYEPTLKIVHRTGELMRSHEAKVVQLWLSVDPLAHKMPSWSPYSYCFNNPLIFTDPDGRIPYPITIRAFAPFKTFGFGFHGDNRGYSTYQGESSRVTNWIAFDTDKTSITTGAYSSPTWHTSKPNIIKTAKPEAEFRDGLSITKKGDNKTFEFGTHVEGSNPLTPGAPNIDVFSDFSITENKKAGTLNISGNLTGDNFPSTEAFITDPSGQALFIGVGQIEKGTNPNTGPGQLFGEDESNPITSFNFTITTDKNGNFTGVREGKKTYSISDWNKRFEQKKPVAE